MASTEWQKRNRKYLAAYQKAWRLKNPEKARAQGLRAYRKRRTDPKHMAKRRKYAAKYRKENAGKLLKYFSEYRAKHRAKQRAYARKWRAAHRDSSSRYEHKWRERHPNARTILSRKYQEKYPERRKAHRILRWAVDSGKLVRPRACSNCGKVGKIDAHHPDYAKPREVVWLCRPCHAAINSNLYVSPCRLSSTGTIGG